MVYSGGTGANQGLKANRNLIGKRAKKKLSYVSKQDKAQFHKQEVSEEQLIQIRKKLQKQQKKEHIKLLLCTIGALVLLFLISKLIDFRFFWDNFKY